MHDPDVHPSGTQTDVGDCASLEKTLGKQRREVLLSASDLVPEGDKKLAVQDTDTGRVYTVYFMNKARDKVKSVDVNINDRYVYIVTPFATQFASTYTYQLGTKMQELYSVAGSEDNFVRPVAGELLERSRYLWFPPEMLKSKRKFAFRF